MIKIIIPATSANLGSGFDACGMALNMYNTVLMQESDEIDITTTDGSKVPTNEKHMIYSTVRKVFEIYGKKLNGLKIVQTNGIPMARGLGSSSACIVAGLLGANEMLGNPMTRQEILTLGTKIEGHPDNIAPALLGGFVVSAYDEGNVYSLKKAVLPSLQFIALIPNFKLLTEKARAVLPNSISHKDAIYNLSRAALLATAFCEERYDFLQVATKDALHHQYRLPLIQGGTEIFDLAKKLGAPGVFISGAGPTILCALPFGGDKFYSEMKNALQEDDSLNAFKIHRLNADNIGAVVENHNNK